MATTSVNFLPFRSFPLFLVIWASACSGTLGLQDHVEHPRRVLLPVLHLTKNFTPVCTFSNFAVRPWLHVWWPQVLGCMCRLSNMPVVSLQMGMRKDNITDAGLGQHSACSDCAKGIARCLRRLGTSALQLAVPCWPISRCTFLDRPGAGRCDTICSHPLHASGALAHDGCRFG